MANSITTFPAQPYGDDFNTDKNFYRILFKPGYAVQARELTQLQTQLQNQIAKFGSHIFQDGTIVLGAERVFDNRAQSIKIDPTYAGNPVVLSNFISQVGTYKTSTISGVTVVGQTSGTKAIVSFAVAAVNTDPNTLLVKIVSGESFTAGETIMIDGSITIGAVIKSVAPFNDAMTYSIQDGIFFINGNFVHCPAQSVVLDKYSNTSDWNVGLVVNETVETAAEDASLLDPASGTPNYAAPGADRYAINLVLTPKTFATTLTNFVEVTRITGGTLTQNTVTTVYSELEKEFARRTYDESGDYTVRAWKLSLVDHVGTAKASPVIVGGQVTGVTIINAGTGYTTAPTVTITDTVGTGAVYTANINVGTGEVISFTQVNAGTNYTSATKIEISGDPTQLTATLDPGKAYVKGYEFETIAQSYLSIPRARTYDSVESANITPSYGNYVYTTNINGVFDTTSYSSVELHSVSRANIATNWGANVTSVTTLGSTTVTSAAAFGSVLANMIVAGPGIPAGAYVVSKSDASTLIISQAATATSAGTSLTYSAAGLVTATTSGSTTVTSAALFGSLVAGMQVSGVGIPVGSFITAIASTSSMTISQAATATGTPTLFFGITPIGTAQVRFLRYASGTVGGSTSIYKMYLFNVQIALNKFFKDTESIGIRTSALTTATYTSSVDIDLNSKVGGATLGDVFLTDSGLYAPMFSFPNPFVKTVKDISSITHTNYTFQRVFANCAFIGGQYILNTNNGTERFMGSAGAAQTDTIKDTHYILIVTTPGASGYATGAVLRLDTGSSRLVTLGADSPGASQSCTISGLSASAFTATVICTINGTAIGEKTKALSNWTGAYIASPGTTQGAKSSLLKSDVYRVGAVWNTHGVTATIETSAGAVGTNGVYFNPTTGVPTWGSNHTGPTEVTQNYLTDTGQTDEMYANGAIILNGAPPLASEHLVVCYKYFTHSGTGYFSVDSYSGLSYSQIPNYYSPVTGQVYRLGDILDFRPRQGDSAGALTGGQIPDPTVLINYTYQYYLPRVDKIVATNEKAFEVKSGSPALTPKMPTDETNGMTLYVLTIPPYTASPSNIKVTYIENKRYTMRDIGKIEKRVSNLEYYTQLSLLEKQVQDEVINDSSNLSKFKNGYLVDPFSGFSVCDMGNPDYNCAIHPVKMECQAPIKTDNVNFNFNSTGSTNAQQNGNAVNATFTEVNFIDQPLASELINVNPFDVVDFVGAGTVNTFPVQDTWTDTGSIPSASVVEQNTRALTASDFSTALSSTNKGNWDGQNANFWNPTTQAASDKTGGLDLWQFANNNGWESAKLAFGAQGHDFTGGAVTINGSTPGNVVNNVGGSRGDWVGWGDASIDKTFADHGGWFAYDTTKEVALEPVYTTSSYVETTNTLETWVRPQALNILGTGFKPKATHKCFIDSLDLGTVPCSDSGPSAGGTYTYTSSVRIHPALTIQTLVGDKFLGDQVLGGMNGEQLTIKYGGPSGTTVATCRCLLTTPPLKADSTKRTVYIYDVQFIQAAPYNGMMGNYGMAALQTQINSLGTNYFTVVGTHGNYAYVTAAPAPDWHQPLVSDEFGNLPCRFRLPANTILCGTRVIKLIDNNIPLLTRSSGQGTWYAQGTLVTQQTVYVTTIEQAVGTVTTRTWADPLAQSFLIDETVYPNGLSLSSVELFFGLKSDSTDIKIQICDMVNGTPNTTKVYEGSVVTLHPADVNTSLTGTVATKFSFAKPLYLPAGEYCVNIMSNCNDYEVFAAKMGAKTLGADSKKITQQPYTGVLFKSQNNSTWSASQEEDITFRINRADYATYGSAIFDVKDPTVTLLKGTIANGSTSVTSVTYGYTDLEMGVNRGLSTGMLVVGTGIPSNTTIISISGTTLTLSKAATASTTALDIKSYPLIDYGMINLRTANTVSAGIQMAWGIKTLNTSNNTPATYNGGAGATMDANWSAIEVSRDIFTPNLKLIVPASENGGNASMKLKVSWLSNSSVLSPIINLPALSSVMVKNLINNTTLNELSALGGPPAEASFTASIGPSSTTMTVSAVAYGQLTVGMYVNSTSGTATTSNTYITGFVGGSGGVGTYTVNNSQSVTSTSFYGTNGNATAKYITKIVNLNDGFDASNLTVTFSGFRPVSTDFAVYYKVLPVENATPITAVPWVQMIPSGSLNNSTTTLVGNSVNASDLREYMYYPPGAFGNYGVPVNNPISSRFNAFVIKVVMLSSSVAVTPKIRNFRVIALDT